MKLGQAQFLFFDYTYIITTKYCQLKSTGQLVTEYIPHTSSI